MKDISTITLEYNIEILQLLPSKQNVYMGCPLSLLPIPGHSSAVLSIKVVKSKETYLPHSSQFLLQLWQFGYSAAIGTDMAK